MTRVTLSVSGQLDDMDVFLSTFRRFIGVVDRTSIIVGELACWVIMSTNLSGHHLNQDINPKITPYGALTEDICNSGVIDYLLNYGSSIYFATTLMPS